MRTDVSPPNARAAAVTVDDGSAAFVSVGERFILDSDVFAVFMSFHVVSLVVTCCHLL